jgi:hypothetical protein
VVEEAREEEKRRCPQGRQEGLQEGRQEGQEEKMRNRVTNTGDILFAERKVMAATTQKKPSFFYNIYKFLSHLKFQVFYFWGLAAALQF